ncbi:MAG: DUF4115 domain-containing protein [Anaerolineae bacterium]|nr:DUF4115 domain-containing protein [Anaerolineae bacterium]
MFVIFDVVQRTWVRIMVDGVMQFEGVATPGTRLQYQGSQSVAVRAGNAAGLDVVVNDRAVGPLGGRGEVVDLTITLDNIDTLFAAQMAAPEIGAAETSADVGEADTTAPLRSRTVAYGSAWGQVEHLPFSL